MENLIATITHISGRRAGESLTCATWPASIGRAPSNAIQLAAHDTRASAKHAVLHVDGADVYLQDLGSTNGTFIQGRRVTYVKLANGDEVEFGIGGPRVRFEFPWLAVVPAPAVAAAAAPGPAPPSVGRTVALDGDWAGNIPTETTHLGMREFPLRGRYRYVCYGLGAVLTLAAIVLSVKGPLLLVIPTVLLGLFLLLVGWSYSRVNITITPRGIEYQGIMQQFTIPWDDITLLHAERSRTRLLTHLVYTVRSPRHTLTFTVSGFTGGLELAQLLSRRTGRQWE